jgi:signal transduction histidine kinase
MAASKVTLATKTRTEILAAMLAHELRNPLASAQANLTAAAELTDQEDPRKRFLTRTLGELSRVSQILESCLELGRAGKISPEMTLLGALVRSVLSQNEEMLFKSGVAVSVVGGEVEARADPVLFARCLENLLDNAARAAGAGGKIRIELGRTGPWAEVVVEDDGPGIDPAMAETLFEPFVSGGRGSGLGLFFVRQVVEAHAGSVEVGASRMGGARFVARLPAERPGSEVKRG